MGRLTNEKLEMGEMEDVVLGYARAGWQGSRRGTAGGAAGAPSADTHDGLSPSVLFASVQPSVLCRLHMRYITRGAGVSPSEDAA